MKIAFVLCIVGSLSACGPPQGYGYTTGPLTCTVAQHVGYAVITCPDGSSATVYNGTNGVSGASGTNGTTGVNGTNGTNGATGSAGQSDDDKGKD